MGTRFGLLSTPFSSPQMGTCFTRSPVSSDNILLRMRLFLASRASQELPTSVVWKVLLFLFQGSADFLRIKIELARIRPYSQHQTFKNWESNGIRSPRSPLTSNKLFEHFHGGCIYRPFEDLFDIAELPISLYILDFG